MIDPETRYELGKLRIQHDRWTSFDYRSRGIAGALRGDPELTYHLDALDAIIETTQPTEDTDA